MSALQTENYNYTEEFDTKSSIHLVHVKKRKLGLHKTVNGVEVWTLSTRPLIDQSFSKLPENFLSIFLSL